ncbi:MAG TPA: sensor domain-containing diguanylate cyclase [Rhizobiales bacterium]|nr:sensor domain-containing diguanylate cyclase [Hyphomicrobiales bacterium]
MMRQLPVPLYDLMQRGPFLALATETLRLGHETTPIATWRIITLSLCISLFLALLLSRFGAMKGAVITLSLALLLFSLATKLHQSAHLDADPILPFLSIFFTFMAVQITLHPAFHRLRQAAKSAIGKVDMGLARLFHSSVDAIITFSPEGRILTMNTAAENLFGQTAEKCAGAQLSDILPDHAQSLLSAVSQNRPGRMEARENLPERHIPLHMDMTFNTLPSDEGWIGFASIRDISDIKTREEQYKRAATHDAMTGLPNRAAFKKHLEATLMFAQDTRQTFCVFLMDLNKFKAVNDTLGHHIGDELLIEVARRFKAAIRKGDFVARLGGDEFAIVMSAPSAQSDARILAARIIESIAAPLQLEGHDIDVGTSIGISVFPEHANQSDKLLQLADEAMYTAKRGKFGFTFTGTPLLET